MKIIGIKANKTIKNNSRAWLVAITSFILLCLFLCFLFSCASASDKFLGFLGYNTYDYNSEEAIENLEPQSETAEELKELVKPLLLDRTQLEDFSDPRQVSELYRDAVLNYLLNTNFAKYTGNLDMLKSAEKEYPYYSITTLIPEIDFEKTVYQFFGGDKSAKNASGAIFTYLDKVSAYTIVGQPLKNDYLIEATSLVETENTYKMQFFITNDGDISPLYMALIIKRDDGTRYIKCLEKIADERITAPKSISAAK